MDREMGREWPRACGDRRGHSRLCWAAQGNHLGNWSSPTGLGSQGGDLETPTWLSPTLLPQCCPFRVLCPSHAGPSSRLPSRTWTTPDTR